MENEALLKQFFSGASQQEIADNGFSRRVMARLPQRANRLSQLWTAACVAVAAALFVVFHGWELLAEHVLGLLRQLVAMPPQTLLLMVAATVFGLLFVAVGELLSYEHRLL